MIAPLRLALFDCDGTLVDSQHGIVSAMRVAWCAHDLPDPDPDAVRRVIGLPLDAAIGRLLPQSGAAERHAIGKRYRSAFFEQQNADDYRDPLYPGAGEALETLDVEGFLLGIATNKSRPGLEATLNGHGLAARFVTTQTADDCPAKPNPHMVQRTIAETGVTPAGVAVIGDTVFDIQMAKAAGVASIGVTWGYHDPADLAAAGADAIADAFADLPALVAALIAS